MFPCPPIANLLVYSSILVRAIVRILALRHPTRVGRRKLVAARLHALAVDARRALVDAAAVRLAVLARVVDVDDVEGVQVARDVAEEGEADVDEHVGAAAGY